MLKRISGAMEVPARFWCKVMHPDPMWPIRGYYRCPACLRTYPVLWESQGQEAEAKVRSIKALRPELVALAEAN